MEWEDKPRSISNKFNTFNHQPLPPTPMNNITTTPKERPAETRSFDTLIEDAPSVYPYPRWWSFVERSFLFALSTTIFAIVITFIVTSWYNVTMGRLITGLLGGSLGFLTNGVSLILLIRNKYGPKGYWIWNCLWDIITASCCAGGAVVGIAEIIERRGQDYTGFQHPQSVQMTVDALTYFSLISAVAHFAANVAGFYGIHLVNKRGRVPGAAEHDDLRV
ncbi:hypothetical protein QBC39DRAFT_352647 [Podospora conica]|nr:hypothetical protein QBC39DRAFT_352647 [Schizothecium conicum]